jgi:hypothetical protein
MDSYSDRRQWVARRRLFRGCRARDPSLPRQCAPCSSRGEWDHCLNLCSYFKSEGFNTIYRSLLVTCFLLGFCSSTLKMEAICSSETSESVRSRAELGKPWRLDKTGCGRGREFSIRKCCYLVNCKCTGINARNIYVRSCLDVICF